MAVVSVETLEELLWSLLNVENKEELVEENAVGILRRFRNLDLAIETKMNLRAIDGNNFSRGKRLQSEKCYVNTLKLEVVLSALNC